MKRFAGSMRNRWLYEKYLEPRPIIGWGSLCDKHLKIASRFFGRVARHMPERKALCVHSRFLSNT